MTSFRISRERSLYQSFDARSLQSQQAQLARLREHAASGMAINRPSDDPIAFGRARRMEHIVSRYDSYLRTIDSARSWVNHTEQALDRLSEIFIQASEEAVRAASDHHSEQDRALIASRLESLRAEAVDTINARYGSEYLFGGSRTGVAPFGSDGFPAGDDSEIDGARIRDIGPGSAIPINISGAKLHAAPSGDGLIATLDQLVDALRSGDLPSIQTAMADVESGRDHVAALITETGNTSRRLALAETNLQDSRLLAESRRSELEDADMLDVLLRLQQAETGLQAALQVTARTLQTSILDYLR